MDPAKRKKLAAAGLLGALLIVPIHEGLKLLPYRDTGGVWTDCFGHTGNDVQPGRIQTPEQCDDKLADDLLKASAQIDSCVREPINRNERSAYVDFTYNVGGAAFCGSSIVRNLNAGDHRAACDQVLRWVYVGKKDCRLKASNCGGIVARREAEHAMCTKPEA